MGVLSIVMTSAQRTRLARVVVAAASLCAALTTTVAVAPPASASPAVLYDRLAGIDHLPAGGTSPLSREPGQTDTTTEPSIAVNPTNSANVVVAFMEGEHQSSAGSENLGYATSFDGGKTWNSTELPIGPDAGGNWGSIADPSVTFGPDNHVYISFIGLDTNVEKWGVGLARSVDGGDPTKPWSVKTIDDETQGHDGDWIVADTGAGAGHHPGRLYASWSIQGQVVATYSDNYGDSWQPVPSPVDTTDTSCTPAGPCHGWDTRALVLANGDLGVIADTGSDQAPHEEYLFSHATAPGSGAALQFDPASKVGDAKWNGDDPTAQTQKDGALDPIATVVNPTTGTIWAAWTDGRDRKDGTNDIVLSQSTDNGQTWSNPARVTTDNPTDGINHYMPMLALTTAGTPRVAYRQRQQGPDSSKWSWNVDTYLQQGTPSGTFSAPVRVDSVRTDIRFAATQISQPQATAPAYYQYFLGDYEVMAAAGDTTLIARAEAYPTVKGEAATYPPSNTHQRIWVAAVK